MSGVDAAADRHGPVGLEAPVHRAQLDLRVDVLPELGDHVAVHAREVQVLRAADAAHPRVHRPVHAARLHGAAAARRVHAAVHRTGVDLARRAFDAHLAVHRPGADVHATREPHLEVDRDVVVAMAATTFAARAVSVLVAGRVLRPEGADEDAPVGRLAALDPDHVRIAAAPALGGDDLDPVARCGPHVDLADHVPHP